MGKRKQKVRWCVVDGLKWSSNEQDESSPEGSVTGPPPPQQLMQHREPTNNNNNKRVNNPHWNQAGPPPRFERRHQEGGRQMYYGGDADYCEAEEMPNGFTKIRSKNLDILFKREYYEQKLSQQQKKQLEEQKAAVEVGEAEHHLQEDMEEQEEVSVEQEDTSSTTTGTTLNNSSNNNSCHRSISKNLEDLDPSEIPEFKPMKSVSCDVDTPLASGQQSPFYPPGYYQDGGYGYPPPPARPNLYLYSPSNNTLIPCEEIVIPNPVMNGEGPVYPGPTNIYLAYPVSGPDGRGYVTTPFSPPLNQEYGGGPAYPNYSPSISVDGSQYHSSTPQTPNSGQESGSSTQPTSPPPLVNYHPANWFQREPRTPDFLQHRTEKEVKAESPVDTSPTVQYIPGLPPTQQHSPKKSQKKKKKKKPLIAEHRDSLSSESELTRFCVEQKQSVDPATTPTSVLEVNLTDDLADFMVNPPTDPECSDEETLRNSQDEPILSGMTRDNTMTNLEELPAVTNGQAEEEEEIMMHQSLDHMDSGIEKDLEQMITSDPESRGSDVESPAKSESPDVALESAVEHEIVDDEVEPVEQQQQQEQPQPSEEIQEEVLSEKSFEPAALEVEKETVADVKLDVTDGENEIIVISKECDDIIDIVEEQPSAPAEVDPVVDSPPAPAVVPVVEAVVEVPEVKCETSSSSSALPAAKSNTNKNKRKNKNRKKTAEPALLEGSTPTTEPAESVATPSSAAPPTSGSLSYSAVCSRSRHGPSAAGPSPPCPAAPQEPEQPPVQPVSQQPAAVSEKQPVEEWETVPTSLTASSAVWERKETKKKRRKGGNRAAEVAFNDTPEVYHVESSREEEPLPDLEPVAPVPQPAPAAPVAVKEASPSPAPASEQEDDQGGEERRKSKKKKKRGSEEPEESSSKRVLICDNQIEITFSRSVRRAAEVLDPDRMESISRTGYCDILLIERLGCGISRGSMHCGRLYQGKYTPPERSDGLLPPAPEEEEEGEEEAAAPEEVTEEPRIVEEVNEIDLD